MSAVLDAVYRPLWVIKKWPFSVLMGAVIGLLSVPILSLGDNAFFAIYDAVRPVVTGKGSVEKIGEDEVTIKLSGVKHRACERMAQNAYMAAPDGSLTTVNLERLSQGPYGVTRPLGPFDAGLWRVKPLLGYNVLEVYMQYNCGGRFVINKLARVELK